MRNILLVLLISLTVLQVHAAPDTLTFKDGHQLIGKIKSMQRSVLALDVPYGSENFKVKWMQISEIHTASEYIVAVKNRVYEGKIASISPGEVKIYTEDTLLTTTALENIVYIRELKQGFSGRFSAAVELGFNIVKAEDMRQFSSRFSAGYQANKWSADAMYSTLRSDQNEIDRISRTDFVINYRRIIYKDWYGIATISTLSNTAQVIDIRANSQVGVGNYLFASNKAFWGIKAGVNNNLEKFSNEESVRESWESYFGTELSLYNVGDVDLALRFIGYTGLTERGRYRSDLNFDIKYELPLDLFIRLGTSLNFDNQPANNASELDYMIRTGIGWEW